ncbi:MAG: beta-galactosidase [Lachnospiraceae bacterium]|nr:beta-galactosidase [Lachnospiraceae bacterium]
MGTCYYPEHWDRELWDSDIDRMLDCGISVIRIAEFAWNFFEPEEGVYTFDFFDDFLRLCEKKGMKVIMCTPTATPPAWLTGKYPEVLTSDIDGNKYKHGGRRHYNYNSETYRRFCSVITEKLALHYGDHKAVIGWQIDNEFNCELDEFYSEADTRAFRIFLKEKYKTIDELNRAWGTSFWNQTYNDFEEISVPARIPTAHNPHQMLDYHRFISGSVLSFCKLQSDILREHIRPGAFITTNGMFGYIDNHRMTGESLDVYTYDSYPSFAFGLKKESWVPKGLKDRHWSRNLTEVRSICPHFGIMEQQSGANGSVGGMEGPAPRPGQLTLWAMQSVAHGADYISFFRWRTACFGAEMYWHGILDHDNRDNRKISEVKSFHEKLQKINEICGSDFEAELAYLTDYDNEWDTADDIWHKDLNDVSSESIFLFTQKNHIPYDYVFFNDKTGAEDLLRYKYVIYPHPVLMDEKRTEVLYEYVRRGGILIVGAMSGAKDLRGHCVMKPGPGLLSKLTGSDVKESTFVHENDEGMTASDGKRVFDMPLYNEILTVKEGEENALKAAFYDSGYYKGEAALIENSVEKGKVYHLGGVFSEENLKTLSELIGMKSLTEDIAEVPEDIEAVLRSKGEKKYLFLLNYMFEPEFAVLKCEAEDLFTGERVSGRVEMKPFEVRVFKL